MVIIIIDTCNNNGKENERKEYGGILLTNTIYNLDNICRLFKSICIYFELVEIRNDSSFSLE